MVASSRITYNPNSVLGGQYVAQALHGLITSLNQLQLAVRVANEVTGNGVTPANLEGSAEFGVGVGQGATFLNDIGTLAYNLNNILGGTAIPDLWEG